MKRSNVFNVNKPEGLTPLQAIEKFKLKFPEYADQKIAYAGRLDPMAEGVLILLVGEECKNRDEYQDLDKKYYFEILLGIETDTLDPLGLISGEENLESRIQNLVSVNNNPEFDILYSKFIGLIELEYPAYSSFNVQGKPLLWWARNNKLNEIEIPKKKVNIHSIEFQGSYLISQNDLLVAVQQRIEKVEGDFRQREILKKWNEVEDMKEFNILKFEARVSSGTYIRVLSKKIAESLGTIGIAYRIVRLQVGEFEIKDSLHL